MDNLYKVISALNYTFRESEMNKFSYYQHF